MICTTASKHSCTICSYAFLELNRWFMNQEHLVIFHHSILLCHQCCHNPIIYFCFWSLFSHVISIHEGRRNSYWQHKLKWNRIVSWLQHLCKCKASSIKFHDPMIVFLLFHLCLMTITIFYPSEVSMTCFFSPFNFEVQMASLHRDLSSDVHLTDN